MTVNIQMGNVNDLQIIKTKEAALAMALSWVRHWQNDAACGLMPTPDSLAVVEARLAAALAMEAGR